MDRALLPILREALKGRQRKEPFERALGRAVRRHGLDFKVYIALVSELRERARAARKDIESAARLLLAEDGQEP